jgi:hypothetical protein
MKFNRKFTRIAGTVVLVSMAAVIAEVFTPIKAEAAAVPDGADYTSAYTYTFSIRELIRPAINASSDDSAVYRQLWVALMYHKITQADIYEMRGEGDNISNTVLKQLADQGYIASYIYKYYSGEAVAADDFSDVFDYQYYYNANPELAAAGVPLDVETLFSHFITNGLNEGRVGSASFNVNYFKANYPEIAEQLGGSNYNCAVYFIIYGKINGLVADRLLK